MGIAVRGPKDGINIRILQTMISGIPRRLGLRTTIKDTYAYVVFWERDPALNTRISRFRFLRTWPGRVGEDLVTLGTLIAFYPPHGKVEIPCTWRPRVLVLYSVGVSVNQIKVPEVQWF